jgi:predicted membrane protein
MTDNPQAQRDLTRLIIGLTIIAAGILFTLDNLRIVDVEDFFSYWPVILVAIGVARLVQTGSWTGFGWSLLLIVAGLWLLGEHIGLISISIWRFWPLVLVLIGANLIRRACCPPRACCAPQSRQAGPTRELASGNVSTSTGDSFIRGVAVMAGLERASASADFRGADLVAIMGGCNLDLRHATIAGDEAIVDVFAFMGGIEIYIPRNWTVEAKVLPLMGGLGDETKPTTTEPTRRLVVRGLALMGGVEIKN